jgi:hypothetical protein
MRHAAATHLGSSLATSPQQGTAPVVPTPPVPPSLPVLPSTGTASGQTGPVGQTPAPPSATSSLDELNAQLVGLRSQLHSYQDQARLLRSQLRHAHDAGERAQLISRYADAQTKAAQTAADIARLQAEIATRQGTEAGTESFIQPFGTPMRGGIDPDYVAGLMFAFIFAVAMPIAIAYARRIWKGKPAPAVAQENPATAQRLERMEQAIDSIAIEVERISEAQRFVTKVLAEKPQVVANAATANGNGAAPVEQQVRALAAGAAPVEPVVKKSEKLRV